jgi:hypothetical protein
VSQGVIQDVINGTLRRRVSELSLQGHSRQNASQTVAPKIRPMPAVNAIASAPQNVTRMVPRIIPAPPVRAAKAPNAAKKTSEVADTITMALPIGTIAAVINGIAAPTANVAADASAAWTGRAL